MTNHQPSGENTEQAQSNEAAESHGGHGHGSGAILAALGANLGIAALKFIAYALTRSSSMLAEGIHSVADSGNQILLLVGGKAAQKDADADHPFGYGRNRYFYAFVVSIIIFALGGLFALYEGIEKWQHPHGIDSWAWVPVAVLVGSILLEGNSFRVAVKESKPLKGKQSWWRFLRTSKNPELPVLLLEDAGALLGLILALIGVGMTLLTGDGRWDAAGTMAIGVLLVAIAGFLAVEIKSLLIGEAASPEDLLKIRAALQNGDEGRIIHLKTVHLGPEEILVAAKIRISDSATGLAVAREIDEAEVRIRAAVPAARVIYLEPDVFDPEREEAKEFER